ncbi:protein of unknown function (plasmid) [Paraburkholderia dioscoreae]|uniref:Uncharacterized protein n=1 Tax=Paraburkholderia dioscoreae TaxID=2604047 RepID=A0A5Q4ZGQ4_9BURK|nr:protein of unknown function [Paraburkholderia dioscoreae]
MLQKQKTSRRTARKNVRNFPRSLGLFLAGIDWMVESLLMAEWPMQRRVELPLSAAPAAE